MPVLNLRNSERSETGQLIGQGRESSTSQNRSGNETLHPLPSFPEHVQKRIYDVVKNANGWVSRSDIAKAMGLKKTPWLHMHIELLVSDGYLHRDQVVRPNGMVMFFYEEKR